MSNDYAKLLNPERALIFRIIHRKNLPWVLRHGLHCGNSAVRSPDWVSIGRQELIDKRARWPVDAPPGGVLNDYVPFYFTPFSVMMHNITTGWHGVQRYPKSDILILVADLRRLLALGLTLLFTDCHANTPLVNYYSDLAHLDRIDWSILQSRDFKRDPEDPGKFQRYQAETLVYQHCPLRGLSGIVCHSAATRIYVEQALAEAQVSMPVADRPGWYF